MMADLTDRGHWFVAEASSGFRAVFRHDLSERGLSRGQHPVPPDRLTRHPQCADRLDIAAAQRLGPWAAEQSTAVRIGE